MPSKSSATNAAHKYEKLSDTEVNKQATWTETREQPVKPENRGMDVVVVH